MNDPPAPPSLVLVNPNTNAVTTATMRRIASEAAPAGIAVEALTAPFGAPLITHAEALDLAADAVAALADRIAALLPLGVIVSAFGDPGLQALRERLACPVTGIAEAGMAEAAAAGPFAVATTTPDLVERITAAAGRYGHKEAFLGVTLTAGDVHAVMADAARLEAALEAACREAVERLGARAVVIGGGPLAEAARALAGRIGVPVVAPIPAAVRLACRRAGLDGV